ncbi:MAG: hypothetical protein WD825_09090 [Gemmatimonadaceae bacterium]
MKVPLLTAVMLLGACAHGPTLFRSSPTPEPGADSYQRALAHVDPSNKQGTLDSALKYFDLYLSSPGPLGHRAEAEAMRRLVRDAQQLARVEAALHQARTSENKPREQAQPKGRDEESLKEIQRLKEELAKANEELERIRKRLATPKPPSPHSE